MHLPIPKYTLSDSVMSAGNQSGSPVPAVRPNRRVNFVRLPTWVLSLGRSTRNPNLFPSDSSSSSQNPRQVAPKPRPHGMLSKREYLTAARFSMDGNISLDFAFEPTRKIGPLDLPASLEICRAVKRLMQQRSSFRPCLWVRFSYKGGLRPPPAKAYFVGDLEWGNDANSFVVTYWGVTEGRPDILTRTDMQTRFSTREPERVRFRLLLAGRQRIPVKFDVASSGSEKVRVVDALARDLYPDSLRQISSGRPGHW